MDDLLGKMLAIVVGVTASLAIILLSMTSIMDRMVQDYVDLRTNQLVDAVRSNGYLSQEMYLNYIMQLQGTGNVYDITMTHEHQTFIPVYDDSGMFLNDYQSAYENTYEKGILEEVMGSGTYTFTQGDYFYMHVSSKNQTIGSKMRSFFAGTSGEVGTISTYYGGVIRNEFF